MERKAVQTVTMQRTTYLIAMLAVCLCWTCIAHGAQGIVENSATLQQPPDAAAAVPQSVLPPAVGEEIAPGTGQLQAASAGPEVVPQPPAAGVAASMPGTIEDGIVPPGPFLADGQAMPPTASTRDWFDFHNWYTQDDYTILDHPKPKRNIALLFDWANAHNSFDTENLSLGIASGTHLTLGCILDREKNEDYSVEVTYQGPEDWESLYKVNASQHSVFSIPDNTATVGSLDNALNQFLGGFNGMDSYVIRYQSDLNSLELNYRIRTELGSDQLVYDPDTAVWVRRVGNGVTFSYLIGIRDLDLDERFNETAIRTSEFVGPASGTYNLKCNNNLAALQFGGEFDYQYQRFFAAVRGSVAPAINFADMKSNIMSTDPILGGLSPVALTAANDGPACISEFRLEGGYELRPNVRLRVTYDFEWLTSVALAPMQVNLSSPNPGKIIVSSDMMLNGASVGLDVSW